MCFRLPAHQLRVVIKSIYQLHEILSWHDNTSSERMDGNVSNMQLPQLLIPFLHFYWSGWSWFRFLHMPHVYFAFKRCIGRYWTTWCLSICSLTHYYFKPFTKCTDSDQNLKLAKKCPWLRDHSLLKVLIYKGSKGRDMEFQSEQDFVTGRTCCVQKHKCSVLWCKMQKHENVLVLLCTLGDLKFQNFSSSGEGGHTPRPPYRGVLHSVLPSRLVNALCR